jgi:hypothetical protein
MISTNTKTIKSATGLTRHNLLKTSWLTICFDKGNILNKLGMSGEFFTAFL